MKSLNTHQSRIPKPWKDHLFQPALNSTYIGLVRDNVDPQKMGRLTVWIPEFGPDQPESYVIVSYASPFAGNSPLVDAKKDDDVQEQRSYGWWSTPPDLGNRVLCCFANGDSTKGFYFASIWGQNMNHMVPSIPMGKSTDEALNKKFSPLEPPTTEYNKKNTTLTPLDPKRPAAREFAEQLIKQGLWKDYERGVSGSSARRESPSKVMGLLSPGGNSMYVDDDPDNQHIRFRTKSGVQILVHETSGYIYMNTKEGNSWLEISDQGIEVFSEGPISFRSQDDINIHADKDINIDGENVNIKAATDVGIESKAKTNIKASTEVRVKSGTKTSIKAGSDLAMKGESNTSVKAGGTMSIISTGQSVRKGSAIKDNSGGSDGPDPVDATVKDGVKTSTVNRPSVVSKSPNREPYFHSSTAASKGSSRTIKKADGKTVDNVPTNIVEEDNTPVPAVGTTKVTGSVGSCIMKASQRTGVPFETLMAFAYKESTLDPKKKNGDSVGLFQMQTGAWNDMWKRYGPNGTKWKNPTVVNDRLDSCSNALLGAYYVKEHLAGIKKAGFAETATNAYMLHLLGPTGGKTFLRALANNPNQLASSVISSSSYKNNHEFHTNNKLSGPSRTLQSAYDLINSKITSRDSQWASYKNDLTT